MPTGPEQSGPSEPLALRPVTSAPSAARRHVRRALAASGLEHLAEAATLAVSELVTNAILHARAELTVRVLPRPPDRVRIEVADDSPTLPQTRAYTSTAAVGRGLAILGAMGTWGVARLPGRPGKVVWFESSRQAPDGGAPPAAAPDDGGGRAEGPGRTGGPDDGGQDHDGPDDSELVLGRYDVAHDGALVTVRLLRFPLQLFAGARERHDEVIREFTLLALAEPPAGPDRPLPNRLLELVDVLGRRYRSASERADKIRDEAAERGVLSIDLTYRVPTSARTAMISLERLMDEADDFCRGEHLLTLAAHPVEREFRHWFSREFVRQIDGAEPSPWDGPLRLPR